MYTSDIIQIALIVSIYTISVPSIIYYSIQFYKQRECNIISCRHPSLVLCLQLIVIASLVLDRTPRMLHFVIDFGGYYPEWIQQLIACLTSYALINLLAVKSYLSFYQHRLYDSMQTNTWKTALNHNVDNWYIRNKNKWGSFKYVSKWVSIPYILVTINSLIYSHIGYAMRIKIVIETLFAIMPIIVLFIFIACLRKFYDYTGIRREILYQSLLFLVIMVIYIAVLVIAHIYVTDEHLFHTIYHLSSSAAMILLHTMIGVSSVYYPLKLRQSLLRLEGNKSNGRGTTISTLLQCFADYHLFSLFMSHLIKEFATESALFILEWCQIKHQYQLNHNGVIKLMHPNFQQNVESNLPSSQKIQQKASQKQEKNKTPTQVRRVSEFIVIDLNSTNDSSLDIEQTMMATTLPNDSTPRFFGGTPILDYNTPVPSKTPTSTFYRDHLGHHSLSYNARTIAYVLNIEGNCDLLKIEFSGDLPQSDILQKHPNLIKEQIKMLYRKYISENSAQAVNIPYEIRAKIERVMEQIDGENGDGDGDGDDVVNDELWTSMDECCLNVLTLLIAPYQRFKCTKEYAQYVNSMEIMDGMKKKNEMEKPRIYDGEMFDEIRSKYKV